MTRNPKDVILSSAGITASLVLAESTIFLSGFSRNEQAESPPALVRGSLILRFTKPVKIKAISLDLKGISRTEWPEGIPGEKNETYEQKEVFSHEWRFFSAQFPHADKSSGAHSVLSLERNDSERSITAGSNAAAFSANATTTPPLLDQHDAVSKGYRVFNPAEYVYNFELMLPQRLPETVKCNFGQTKWGMNLGIERPGAFKPKLTGHRELTLLRSLGPSNLEVSEPIVINRDWEDLLHYEIIIAGKAFVIGQSFNVAFALVPLAKVKCHRIRIYITEHTEYFCRNHRIHRVEPSHKFLLLEKRSPQGHRGDLLTSSQAGLSGLNEFEFEVQIPDTFPSRRDYLRPNANTESIKVYHWIKAVMRLSREDRLHNGEPKCYEVSIDSPITLLDQRTLQKADLPDYGTARGDVGMAETLKPYQEFIQTNGDSNPAGTLNFPNNSSQSSTSSRQPSHLETEGPVHPRAIHFVRKPSVAPPPFDADIQPPPVESQQPPGYDQVSAESYEVRYEQYLRTQNSEPSAESHSETVDEMSDNTSDSNTSVTSVSDVTSASSTQPEEPKTEIESEKTKSWAHKVQRQSEETPVFSEIIWSEDQLEGREMEEPALEIDPRAGKFVSAPGSPLSPQSISPQASHGPHPRVGSANGASIPPKPLVSSPPATATAPLSASPRQKLLVKENRSASFGQRAAPPRSSLGSAAASSHLQRLRVSSSGMSSANQNNVNINPLMRRSSLTQPRVSLKTPTSVSLSAGSPLQQPWADSEKPANSSLFKPSFQTPASAGGSSSSGTTPVSPVVPPHSAGLDRRASTGSVTSGGPRYFRQSSVVSMDISRQAEMMRRDSRRTSRVGEVQELRDWQPLSRTASEASFAVSIAEYQSLQNEYRPQAHTPLLGDGDDNDAEIDIGLEWEQDFEDYDMGSDRGSVVSAFYTVLTP